MQIASNNIMSESNVGLKSTVRYSTGWWIIYDICPIASALLSGIYMFFTIRAQTMLAVRAGMIIVAIFNAELDPNLFAGIINIKRVNKKLCLHNAISKAMIVKRIIALVSNIFSVK